MKRGFDCFFSFSFSFFLSEMQIRVDRPYEAREYLRRVINKKNFFFNCWLVVRFF